MQGGIPHRVVRYDADDRFRKQTLDHEFVRPTPAAICKRGRRESSPGAIASISLNATPRRGPEQVARRPVAAAPHRSPAPQVVPTRRATAIPPQRRHAGIRAGTAPRRVRAAPLRLHRQRRSCCGAPPCWNPGQTEGPLPEISMEPLRAQLAISETIDLSSAYEPVFERWVKPVPFREPPASPAAECRPASPAGRERHSPLGDRACFAYHLK